MPTRGVTLEVQAARSGAEMVTLYNDVIPEAGELPLGVPNEVPHCVRARVNVFGVESAWSPVVCGTPRLDPEPPTLDVALSPPSACVDAAATVAGIHLTAFDGNPDLLQRLYPDGRMSFDPEAVASGVAEMRIAVDSNVDDAPWQPFSQDFTISLGSAGSVNLGVRLRDAFGNESDLQARRIVRCSTP